VNQALIYLWLILGKRRMLHFVRGLRRPSTLIGIAALLFFLGACFHYRHTEIFGWLVRPASLVGGALVMLGGSVFRGFLQRGLLFELPDVEFLFTSPFTQKQLVFYKLLPGYFFALIEGLVFLGLFAPHLSGPPGFVWVRPVVTATCLILFQIICFHIAAWTAIFAGTLSTQIHHRVRWMLLATYFFATLLYLRLAWDVKLIPSPLSSPLVQVLFYPNFTLSDIAATPVMRDWALHWSRSNSLVTSGVPEVALYLCIFAIAAIWTFSLLMRLKCDIFEPSLATTTRVAEKRRRLQEGRGLIEVAHAQISSVGLPKLALFRGVGALVWKNLVSAKRSKHQMFTAAAFALIYIGFLVALRCVLHHHLVQGAELPERQIRDFDSGLAGLLSFLAFLLQRAFPFDFRRDGSHLLNFRTLPVSPIALVLAEIAVPVLLCLAFQAIGILALLSFAGFDWLMLLFVLLSFPAVALALNCVWNIHYLLAATKRAGGKADSAGPVTILMVVVLSFLVFYPAGWAGVFVGKRVPGQWADLLGFTTGLSVQYLIDIVLVALLARLFHRFQVSRDS